jgi:hypothetical protein
LKFGAKLHPAFSPARSLENPVVTVKPNTAPDWVQVAYFSVPIL